MDKQQEFASYNTQQNQGMPQLAPPAYSTSTSTPAGYAAPTAGYVPTTAAPQAGAPHTYVTQHTTVTTKKDPTGLRTAIPELPMALAIILCIVNCILPGIGTIIAGFSVLCCGNVGQSGGGRFATFCINFWVGIAQIVLVLFFVGWIWSIIWGIAFIGISAEAQRKSQTTTTTTVTTTGAPGAPMPAQTTTAVYSPDQSLTYANQQAQVAVQVPH